MECRNSLFAHLQVLPSRRISFSSLCLTPTVSRFLLASAPLAFRPCHWGDNASCHEDGHSTTASCQPRKFSSFFQTREKAAKYRNEFQLYANWLALSANLCRTSYIIITFASNLECNSKVLCRYQPQGIHFEKYREIRRRKMKMNS